MHLIWKSCRRLTIFCFYGKYKLIMDHFMTFNNIYLPRIYGQVNLIFISFIKFEFDLSVHSKTKNQTEQFYFRHLQNETQIEKEIKRDKE